MGMVCPEMEPVGVDGANTRPLMSDEKTLLPSREPSGNNDEEDEEEEKDVLKNDDPGRSLSGVAAWVKALEVVRTGVGMGKR